MTHAANHSRRGAALLLVLATLVLLTSAAAALGRIAATTHARRSFDVATSAADDLARQAERAALLWLESESERVVLPVDAVTPEVSVLHDEWTWSGTEYSVQVTAWDQTGLVPYGAARAGSPLRSKVPRELRRALDRGPGGPPIGLDQFESPRGLPSPYPRARHAAVARFGDGDFEPEFALDAVAGRAALGAFVATHNSQPERINVNTAPLPVIEAAMRMAGIGGIEAIEEARGKAFLTTVGPAAPVDDENGTAPQLVTRSDVWALRIDVRVGRVTRSWWAVFEYEESWSCVQRLGIPG